MKKDTLEALQGSIAKWQGIVDNVTIDKGVDNCPLCKKFLVHYNGIGSLNHCEGCPVRAFTSLRYCSDTPYSGFAMTRANLPSTATRRGKYTKKAHAVLLPYALDELQFLKSLLPKRLRG